MKSYQKKKLDKLMVENQLNIIKDIKADHNNIILNAAAFQQEIMKDFNFNVKKNFKVNRFNKEKQTKISVLEEIRQAKEGNKIYNFLPIIKTNTIEKKKEKDFSDSCVHSRRKEFLSNLSLAQKIGLAEIPNMPLSIQEWKLIEEKSMKRNDHTLNCPICLDSLAKRETIILSCTHIFHKVYS
jgi:hypothetical protein